MSEVTGFVAGALKVLRASRRLPSPFAALTTCARGIPVFGSLKANISPSQISRSSESTLSNSDAFWSRSCWIASAASFTAFPDINKALLAVTVPASGVTCESADIICIFSRETPSSSEVICRNDSLCPPPRSGIPHRTTALPSISIPTQADEASCIWHCLP